MKKLFLVFAILLFGLGCEKDDICTDTNATTAKLIIRFYDIATPETPKVVNKLLVQGVDNNYTYGTESTRDSIAIPLRILENNTSYKLIKDFEVNDNGTPDDTSDDFATGNEDVIIINYTNNQVYVSKACGFKNIFTNTNFGFTNDGDNWILNTTIENSTIENQNNAHVHIFH